MKPLALILWALLWLSPASAAPALRLDASIILQMDDPRFGGFSSLEVAADGMSFMATSDRGTLLRGDILRENGRLTGVANLRLTDITDTKGQPLSGYNVDAEGLAVSGAGAVYTSFEANHRVMVQENPDALPEFVPKHPDFRTLQNNSALEALAIDDTGVLYAIPERSGAEERPFPVYRFIDGAWVKNWSISRKGAFLVTGADYFDGQLYVLERRFGGFRGFASRVRRFDIGAPEGEVLMTSEDGDFDNLEGIALWQPVDGAIRVMMIADNNFLFWQKNQLVEMVLDPGD